MSFRIIDPVTGRRQSHLSWPSIDSARAAIADWRARAERGGRPDIPIEQIDRLVIETDYRKAPHEASLTLAPKV